MLLGLKTPIHQTIAGLLQHQMTITQQIVSEIGQLRSSSRRPKTNIRTCLEKPEAGMGAINEPDGGNNPEFPVPRLRLEMRLLVFNEQPPAMPSHYTLSTQWTWVQDASCYDYSRTVEYIWLNSMVVLAAAGDILRSIVRMSKLRLPKLKLPDESSTGKSSPSTPFPKQLVVVRLRHRERANQVVLSSAEKYSFANAMSLDDELYQRVTSTIDPVDAMTTAKRKEVFENQDIEDVTDGISSGYDIASTQLAVPGPDERTAPPSEKEDEASTTPQMLLMSPNQSAELNRFDPCDSVNPRSPQQRLAVHKYPTELTAMFDELIMWSRNTPNVKHVLTTIEKYPVQLTDAYLRSRVIDFQWEAMRTADNIHPFVIPADLTRSMEAAVTTTRKEQRETDKHIGGVSQQ
ncbi:LOW QUALITY PROTEIN: hypothetical protein PHMEG_0001240 [Phytophthora megakarya]|uniref:Uncharacterized protein n=1 Tax=Phytophthora megakarya TaxID=4795 RepID=A0A225X3P0_9STRA|nr:LOW QUALITY PROTEIN: hypothetical protein PHMEG_0001240 [Phytophthora megakarya]